MRLSAHRQPEFTEPLKSVAVAIGEDATFTCHVKYLDDYEVSVFKEFNNKSKKIEFVSIIMLS